MPTRDKTHYRTTGWWQRKMVATAIVPLCVTSKSVCDGANLEVTKDRRKEASVGQQVASVLSAANDRP
jgi:hypothetical protein